MTRENPATSAQMMNNFRKVKWNYGLLLILFLWFPFGYSDTTIRVTDYSGREVVLTKPAQRIIALAPHIVENTFAAGAGDLIVGTVNYVDYPEIASQIPRVGNIQSFNIEAIAALKPDLIIAWSSSISPKVVQQFLDLGFPVYMDEPRQLEDVAKSILHIGLLTGKVYTSRKSSQKYRQQLINLRRQYADRRSVKVLYQIWDSPLQTINGEHIISDIIKLCGGKNSFADALVIAPKISLESVLVRDPEAIIASGMGKQNSKWLRDWEKWSGLTAVKYNNLFYIHPDVLQRHTVRILQGAEKMCQYLDKVRKHTLELDIIEPS